MDNGNSRNNHADVLSVLEDIDPLECRQVMSNYDIYIKRIRKDLVFYTLVAYLNKAEKDHSKKDLYAEEKSLKNVWDLLKSENLTDNDLKEKGARDYISGSFLTLRKVKNRLKKLVGAG